VRTPSRGDTSIISGALPIMPTASKSVSALNGMLFRRYGLTQATEDDISTSV